MLISFGARPPAGISISSSPWMGTSIYVFDPFTSQMCIQLCRVDARMSKQFLNDAQVGSTFQQVRRKRMAQSVRADAVLQTGRPGRSDQHLPGAAPVQPFAPDRNEEWAAMPQFGRFLAEPDRPNRRHIAAKPHDRNLSDRNLPLAIAL